mmetsp:Transcript_67797/g.159592  ORF Transcript_67797/g.159592 Transcript_67797/m.159592 type:complete len:210 (+) Transcript_67797:687-1316(+)
MSKKVKSVRSASKLIPPHMKMRSPTTLIECAKRSRTSKPKGNFRVLPSRVRRRVSLKAGGSTRSVPPNTRIDVFSTAVAACAQRVCSVGILQTRLGAVASAVRTRMSWAGPSSPLPPNTTRRSLINVVECISRPQRPARQSSLGTPHSIVSRLTNWGLSIKPSKLAPPKKRMWRPRTVAVWEFRGIGVVPLISGKDHVIVSVSSFRKSP